MNGDIPKQYLLLGEYPMLAWTLRALLTAHQLDAIYVVLSPDDTHFALLDLAAIHPKIQPLYCGGDTRHASVLNGLNTLRFNMLNAINNDDWVMVHDAARPAIRADCIQRLINECQDDPVGGIVALPIVDTLKRVDPVTGRITATVARDHLWQAQTPQLFRYGVLHHALTSAQQAGMTVTDEASAIEHWAAKMGNATDNPMPKIIMGEPENRKVTLETDCEMMTQYLSCEATIHLHLT